MSVTINIGDIVTTLNGQSVQVLRKGREQYECRLANCSTAYFYAAELKKEAK